MDIAFSMRAINEVLTEPTMNYEIGLDGSISMGVPSAGWDPIRRLLVFTFFLTSFFLGIYQIVHLGSSPVWPSLCLTETFQSWSGREILSFLDLDLSEAGRKLERSSMHPNWSKRRCLFATRIFRQMIRPRLKKKEVFDNLLFKANCSCQSCLCWLIGHCLRYASFHLL